MRKTRLLLILTAAIGAACASTRAVPPLDPVGSYEFWPDPNGRRFEGSMSIMGTRGDWSGTLSTRIATVSLETITVRDRTLFVTARMPDGESMSIWLRFSGDRFTGEWSRGGQRGTMAGRYLGR